MTDPTSDPTPDEELSALLDGEAAPGIAARVANDPSLAHRLGRLREASRLLGEPPAPLSASTVDDLVAQALGAADSTDHQADLSEPTHPASANGSEGALVAPLAPRRGPSSTPRWLVAAVIAVLVGTGLTLVWTGRDGNTDAQLAGGTPTRSSETAGPAEDAFDGTGSGRSSDEVAPGDATAAVGATEAAPDAGSDPDSASEVTDYGTFPDVEALRPAVTANREVGSVPAAGTTTSTTTEAEVERCADQLQALLGRDYDLDGPALLTGTASVDGTDLLVFELAVVDANGLVAAVAIDTCNPELIVER